MTEISDKRMLRFAQIVKSTCIQAAKDGYQDAAMSGLCQEGAIEASISAIEMVDLLLLLDQSGNEYKQ